MPVKIRLSRKGRKRRPFYHIVIADSRAPRDGRFIERVGSYDPTTNPATINLDFDKALDWLTKGAQPTDTVRAILSHKGVLLKKHLIEGVKKGALTEAQVEEKFEAWVKEKEAKINAQREGVKKAKDEEASKQLEAERKINEERAAELAKKQKEAEEAAKAEEAEAEGDAEEAAEATEEAAGDEAEKSEE